MRCGGEGDGGLLWAIVPQSGGRVGALTVIVK